MTRPISILALSGALSLALSSAALADELKPGDKWLECYVGQGGFATHGELFGAVARALDAGDLAALTKLGWDRCAYYRAVERRGWRAVDDAAAALRDLSADGVLDLQARLQIEGVRLSDHPGAEVEADTPVGDGGFELEPPEEERRRIVGTSSSLALSFAAEQVDQRWYLTGAPSFASGGAPVVAKGRRLYGALGDALAKHKKNPAAAQKALAGWWKKRGAELLQVVRAARTLQDPGQQADYAQLRKTFVERLGDLPKDAALAESLAAVLPPMALPIGVPECDQYMSDFQRCAESMPEAARDAVAGALAQAAAAWRDAAKTPEGRANMAVACKAAADAMRESMSAMCPGVFDGARPE